MEWINGLVNLMWFLLLAIEGEPPDENERGPP